jgi:hypothetical protein
VILVLGTDGLIYYRDQQTAEAASRRGRLKGHRDVLLPHPPMRRQVLLRRRHRQPTSTPASPQRRPWRHLDRRLPSFWPCLDRSTPNTLRSPPTRESTKMLEPRKERRPGQKFRSAHNSASRNFVLSERWFCSSRRRKITQPALRARGHHR